jgi:hypothetical protein
VLLDALEWQPWGKIANKSGARDIAEQEKPASPFEKLEVVTNLHVQNFLS